MTVRPQDEIITYTSISNPEWLDERRDTIVCEVKFDHMPLAVDFVARKDDAMPYGREIYQRCFKGEFGWLMVAAPGRVEKLPRANMATSHVVGDLYSNSTDQTFQTYIARLNAENRSGSETGTVVAWGSILDHILKRLLEQNGFTKESSFALRISQALKVSAISHHEHVLLELIRQVRNAFSHEYAVSLNDEPQKSACERLYDQAIGDGAKPSLRLRFSSACSELTSDLVARIRP